MSTETENTYYKYQDYLFYRNIFDAAERNPDKYGVDKNHIIFNAIYSNIKDVFIAKCTKIKGYLTHFYTKDNHKENNRCSYINYFINDEVRKHIYRSKSNTFELFINYIKSDSYLKNNTCISNIKYLENKIYNNMKKLYDLYDKYEAFYRNNHYSADTYWCTDLVDLVKDFNTIVRENDKRISSYLFKELKYIKCFLEKVELIKQKKCTGIEELSSPYRDSEKDTVQCIEQEEPKARSEENEESLTSARDTEDRGIETGIPESDTPRSGITLPLSGAMTGMFCLLLYKYTPVGNKFRHLIHGKSSVSKNMHDEKYKLYINNFENQSNELEGKRYNVSYYSVGNS